MPDQPNTPTDGRWSALIGRAQAEVEDVVMEAYLLGIEAATNRDRANSAGVIGSSRRAPGRVRIERGLRAHDELWGDAFDALDLARKSRDEHRNRLEAITGELRNAGWVVPVDHDPGAVVAKLVRMLAEARLQRDQAAESAVHLEADVTRLKTRLVAETMRLRGHLAAARAARPRIWWPGDEQPEGVTKVVTGSNRETVRLCDDGLWRVANGPVWPSNGTAWEDLLVEDGPIVESIEHVETPEELATRMAAGAMCTCRHTQRHHSHRNGRCALCFGCKAFTPAGDQ